MKEDKFFTQPRTMTTPIPNSENFYTLVRPDIPCCRLCRNSEDFRYNPETVAKLEAAVLCYNCLFWFEFVKIRDKNNIVRIGGAHFIIGDESAQVKGFGGRKFRIMFLKNGKIVETTNLSGQGDIPGIFKRKLPDNAVFI